MTLSSCVTGRHGTEDYHQNYRNPMTCKMAPTMAFGDRRHLTKIVGIWLLLTALVEFVFSYLSIWQVNSGSKITLDVNNSEPEEYQITSYWHISTLSNMWIWIALLLSSRSDWISRLMIIYLATLATVAIDAGLITTTAVNPGCTCLTYDGFYAERTNGTFMSPDYPAPYKSDINCLLYSFSGKRGEIVEIEFHNFQLQARDPVTNRCGDFVRIFQDLKEPEVNEDSEWQQEFCGKEIEKNKKFYSRGSALVFEFHSDSEHNVHTHHGFIGTYRFLNKVDFETIGARVKPEQCMYIIKSTPEHNWGRICSPDYPYYYPSHTRCTWLFKGRPGQIVEVRFIELELRPVNGHCAQTDDMIKIFERRETNGGRNSSIERVTQQILREICSNSQLSTVRTSTPTALVQFQAGRNDDRQSRGFLAEYRFVDQVSSSAMMPSPPRPTLPPELTSISGPRKADNGEKSKYVSFHRMNDNTENNQNSYERPIIQAISRIF